MITAIYNYPFPTLDIDDEYTLREQTIEDTNDFFEYYTDPLVSRYILAKIPTTIKEAQEEMEYCKKLFQYRQGIYWTIARKSDNKMVGAIGLYINNHHHRAEICYDLHKDYWHKGIMYRAMVKVIEYMFRYGGIHRFEAVTVKENAASINILNRLGFVFEGSLRNYRYFNNKPHDVEMFALTKTMFSEHMKKNHP